MKKITLLFVAVSLIAVSACKKEDDKTTTPTPGPTLTKTQMLTAKNWKLTGATSGGVDYYPIIDPCDKDDLFIFKTDGTSIVDAGATKCDPTDPQIISTGTWTFIDNETKIYFDGDTGTLAELTSTKMVVKGDYLGDEVVSTYTAQ